MTTTDWRTLDTPELRAAFGDAQARLDEGDYPPGDAGRAQAEADKALADRYDRLVLQPAHYEFERQCEQDEFDRHFPEPADGARIEFEANGGTLYAAFRQDVPEHEGGSWWLYGSNTRYSWQHLVCEFELPAGFVDVVILVERDTWDGAVFVGDYAPEFLVEVAKVLEAHDDLDVQDIGARIRAAAGEGQ